jgi:hypothetical protein
VVADLKHVSIEELPAGGRLAVVVHEQLDSGYFQIAHEQERRRSELHAADE